MAHVLGYTYLTRPTVSLYIIYPTLYIPLTRNRSVAGVLSYMNWGVVYTHTVQREKSPLGPEEKESKKKKRRAGGCW